MNHLIIPVVMALAAYGMWITMQEGQALHQLQVLLKKAVPKGWLSKPLYACGQCMVSVWGTSFALCFGMIDISNALLIPVYLVLAVGVFNLMAE